MPIALEQFVKQLEDSGVIAPGKLENFVPPKAQPKDAQELARQLVQSKHLTKFQAQEIYAGRAKSLILGNYTILDKIGAGGMGQVFKAEHRRMHRVVAIKMLPKNVTQDAAAAARFQREVEAASKLLHPNIVSAFDADEAGGVHFLAMEFVEGSDLSALVKKNGPLPIATAVNYILQAAKGLEFAHGEGVVHRDIKPANLLLDKKGTIKILDMGLARISTSDDAATQAELTGTGAVLGTVDYMAPEQALSTKHADARADIYSLGCSLHYLVSGKATYAGETLMAKLLAHREKPIPTLGADAPEQLQAVFEKMVAKNVEDRYQSMSEVVADLKECAAGSSTIGKTQTISEPPAEDGNLSFLAEATAHTQHHQPTQQVKPTKNQVGPTEKGGDWSRKSRLLVGGGLLGALIVLAVIVIKMQTKDGTLVVEINQPDAVVQVFDEAGKRVEITQPGGKGSVSISVDPGKHRLQVEKDGFKFFSQDFTVESGGRTEIKATLDQTETKANPGLPATDRAIAEILLADHCMLQVLSDGETGWSVDIHNAAQLPGKPFRVIALKVYGDVRLTGKAIRAACALPQLTALSCTGNHAITDDALRQFRNGLRRITSIDLSNTSVTDVGLQYLGECPAIGTLSLDRTKISDAGLHELERLPAAKAIYLRDTQVTLAGVASLKRALPQCKIEWDDPAKLGTGQPSKPITMLNDPAFQQWMKTVAVTPAEKQVDAVAKKLQEINPGFDGKETHKVVEGEVREFEISAKNIVDIRPVRALVKLRKLNCSMPWPDRSKFADLSPLEGLPLEEVDIDGTDVASLTPLRGMPLRQLSTVCAPVSDLAPLTGMPLATLNLDGTQVADVRPLRGMPLRDLDLRSTAVTDLSPLQQSPLEKLALNSSWSIQDLGPLHGMTTLQEIDLFGTPVFDLSPLAGLKLRAVNVTYSAVNDLSPLKGMPLERLECAMSNVADLSPLADAPLKALNCFFCGVTDLSPLKGMSLSEISFTSRNIRRGVDVLRPMQSLTKIGDDWSTWPPAEFWKKYDAGEIGKPSDKASPALSSPESRQWLKEVAALPAADQVAAVAKRLKELNKEFDGKVTPTIEGNVVTSLTLSGAGIRDLSPIRALGGLHELNCPFTVAWPKQHWVDLAPLKGLPLRRLIVSGNYAADLLPLKGLPLTDLSLNGSGVSDLAPLAEMKLNSLNVGATAVADLLPLHGMKLSTLICERSRVRNLAPLAAMPLHVLDLSQTGVSDLSPLHGMPLEGLSIDRTSVEDLSPLAGMKLKRFCFSPGRIRSGIEAIRAMQSLEQIVVREGRARATFEQTLSPAEFWKKYDAGEFNK